MRLLLFTVIAVSFCALGAEVIAGEQMQPSSDPFCGS